MIDTSIWVDCLRAGSSESVRQQASVILAGHECFICEPVAFELLRAVPKRDRSRTEALLATVPTLPTPPELWTGAQLLGKKCLDIGFLPPPMDLLIAQICLYHGITLVTFDAHFQQISQVSLLKTDLRLRAQQ